MLLSVTDLHAHFVTAKGTLRAVDGVSLTLARDESLGLVGESGCGKSTLGKTILRLSPATSGEIVFDGVEIAGSSAAALFPQRRRMQMIFQDPFGSLNPRRTIEQILLAPLDVHRVGDRAARRRKVRDLIEKVGLPTAALARYPHEFSGGQRQRIGVARALLLEPSLVICDEPVSALDVSIQAQILNLLVDLKREFGLSYIFISHDLSVVRYFTDRVLVMYLGRIVESARTQDLWAQPRHPYTRALMDAIPNPAQRRRAINLSGDPPSPERIPSGCRFHPRCPIATAICAAQEPPQRVFANNHVAACHHATE